MVNYIEYNGEILNLTSISKKVGITQATLRKYYIRANNNIYEAISLAQESRQRIEESLIEYNEEMLTLSAIAKRERNCTYNFAKEI